MPHTMCASRVIAFVLAMLLVRGAWQADAAPPATRSTGAKTSEPPIAPWPKLSADEQAQAVEKLKSFADGATKKLNHPLMFQETQFFLFYTDLPAAEARNWGSLLDRMYLRLAELFAVKKGENIWRGKGLIFVFAKANDYRRYEREVEKIDPSFTAGRCHAFSDGYVHIAFYKQDRELSFAHILVHESVHGFVHRYRSPVHVPSWANEGLAEVIASELVPDPARNNGRIASARDEIKKHGNALGDFFHLRQIDPWQYPIAETLTEYMILQSKKNYVDFINGIKDGLEWVDSLSKDYKAPLERLVPAYGMWVGVKGLTE
jgi:hypothetical protein